ncbi:MAG: lysophospholipid acyltransferase family protein [Deltaproteobacteria bacterium]|nr:lysophospholipid acyltransferase family protein [Deltaproteobacteria bacterium]
MIEPNEPIVPSRVYPLPLDQIREHVREHAEEKPVRGHFATRALMAVITGVIRALSWEAAYTLGGAIGSVLYRLRVRWGVAKVNLDIAFGEKKTASEKDAIYRASLKNLGRQIVNYIRMPLMDDRFWAENFTIENEHLLRDAYNQGRGVVFIYMHFGPWEMAGGKIGHCGYPLSVVAKAMKNPAIDRFVIEARNSMLLGSIKHRDAMPRILAGLRKGEGIVMVIDQNMKRSQGVFVEWMGRVASTVRSASWLARESGAPVITGVARQTGPKSFEMKMLDEIPWQPHPDPAEELVVNTQNYVRVLERGIYAMPEEWFWLNRRWKVQPEGMQSPYGS